jgi:hypothetical protein
LSFTFLWNWVFELRWCNRPTKRLSPLTGFVQVLKSKIQGVIKEFLKWHYHEHFFFIIQKYNVCLIFLPNFKAKFVHLPDIFTILIFQFYGRH